MVIEKAPPDWTLERDKTLLKQVRGGQSTFGLLADFHQMGFRASAVLSRMAILMPAMVPGFEPPPKMRALAILARRVDVVIGGPQPFRLDGEPACRLAMFDAANKHLAALGLAPVRVPKKGETEIWTTHFLPKIEERANQNSPPS